LKIWRSSAAAAYIFYETGIGRPKPTGRKARVCYRAPFSPSQNIIGKCSGHILLTCGFKSHPIAIRERVAQRLEQKKSVGDKAATPILPMPMQQLGPNRGHLFIVAKALENPCKGVRWAKK